MSVSKRCVPDAETSNSGSFFAQNNMSFGICLFVCGGSVLPAVQLKLAVPFVVVALTIGCASITSEKTQSLAVTTHTVDGKLVEKAKCSLKNDKGEWKVETPGAVIVRRSAEDIVVECKKDGELDGIARGISRAAGGM